MTPKQRAFVYEYLKDFNATQAAIRAGYSKKTARFIGCENLTKPNIAELIDEEFKRRAMSAHEVLSRMTDIARGSAEDYLVIDDYGYVGINLEQMKADGKLHLIKKYKPTKFGSDIELYDAQAALALMGKQHGLFPNRQEVTGKDGEPLRIRFIDYGLDDDSD